MHALARRQFVCVQSAGNDASRPLRLPPSRHRRHCEYDFHIDLAARDPVEHIALCMGISALLPYTEVAILFYHKSLASAYTIINFSREPILTSFDHDTMEFHANTCFALHRLVNVSHSMARQARTNKNKFFKFDNVVVRRQHQASHTQRRKTWTEKSKKTT